MQAYRIITNNNLDQQVINIETNTKSSLAPDTWNIGTINVRGINELCKLYILNDWIHENNMDITVITETKLNKSYKSKFNIENKIYNAYYSSSYAHAQGQGVGIIIKPQLNSHI